MHDRPRRNSPKRQLEDWRSGRSLGFGLLAMLAASATSAHAGGLYIQEFATASMGTANAGAQAWADDASAAWSNPAGMTRLEQSEIAVGVGFAHSKVEFDADDGTPAGGGDGGDAGSTAPLGQINGVYKFNDRWSAGISAGGITGAALDYRGGWAGRYQAEDVSLTVIGVNPSLAFKVTDWLSIGGGPVFNYGTLD